MQVIRINITLVDGPGGVARKTERMGLWRREKAGWKDLSSWKDYQKQAAEFFLSLGLEADTDVTVKGVRTKHNVDIWVRSHHAGFEINWIVECKMWRRRINKLHVLALREIVADLGVDCGILLSESGFQSGAIEASNLTNVQVTSIAEMKESAEDSIVSMRLRDLLERVHDCKIRYWDIPKKGRIKAGLRPGLMEEGFSGRQVIEVATDILMHALRDTYPFKTDNVEAHLLLGKDHSFNSDREVEETVRRMVEELESRLNQYGKESDA